MTKQQHSLWTKLMSRRSFVRTSSANCWRLHLEVALDTWIISPSHDAIWRSGTWTKAHEHSLVYLWKESFDGLSLLWRIWRYQLLPVAVFPSECWPHLYGFLVLVCIQSYSLYSVYIMVLYGQKKSTNQIFTRLTPTVWLNLLGGKGKLSHLTYFFGSMIWTISKADYYELFSVVGSQNLKVHSVKSIMLFLL